VRARAAGLSKNARLPAVICTPTTKEDVHDRPISGAEIVEEGWMSAADWEFTAAKALELFRFGQTVAASRGMILVDTKYEFGKDEEGRIHLIDEVHTPDSSRYWLAATYEERLAAGREPDNIDKEFLRLWFRDHCDPYKDVTLPDAPTELVTELSSRYVRLYEAITGKVFDRTAVPPTAAALTAELEGVVHALFPPAPVRCVLLHTRDGELGGKALHAALRGLTSASDAAAGSSAARGTSGSGATGGVLATTPVALETHVTDLIAAPKAALDLAGDLRATGARVPTLALVYAGGSVDHLSRFAAAHTGFPVVTVAECPPSAPAPAALVAGMAEAAATSAPVVYAASIPGAVAHVHSVLKMFALRPRH
jgi:hypothetical protein